VFGVKCLASSVSTGDTPLLREPTQYL
jgi:hypothetical protein